MRQASARETWCQHSPVRLSASVICQNRFATIRISSSLEMSGKETPIERSSFALTECPASLANCSSTASPAGAPSKESARNRPSPLNARQHLPVSCPSSNRSSCRPRFTAEAARSPSSTTSSVAGATRGQADMEHQTRPHLLLSHRWLQTL